MRQNAFAAAVGAYSALRDPIAGFRVRGEENRKDYIGMEREGKGEEGRGGI